jgi:catechol 2,3-dioxygenase-like lactoylglutathione lyase family enzyme
MTQPLFDTLHHVCIVVPELDNAVAYYESLGIGPWQNFPSLDAFTHDLVGVPAEDFLLLRYAYADLGNVQLQLCEPAEGDTPQWRFLSSHGQGVFHLGFSVPDVNAAEAQGAMLGLAPLIHGRTAVGRGFTYFDTRSAGAGVTLQVRSSV